MAGHVYMRLNWLWPHRAAGADRGSAVFRLTDCELDCTRSGGVYDARVGSDRTRHDAQRARLYLFDTCGTKKKPGTDIFFCVSVSKLVRVVSVLATTLLVNKTNLCRCTCFQVSFCYHFRCFSGSPLNRKGLLQGFPEDWEESEVCVWGKRRKRGWRNTNIRIIKSVTEENRGRVCV